jgi:hypothetical protein
VKAGGFDSRETFETVDIGLSQVDIDRSFEIPEDAARLTGGGRRDVRFHVQPTPLLPP